MTIDILALARECDTARLACGFTPEIMAMAAANGADLTLEGVQRRLAATRSAIRYRNPETGKRSHVHAQPFRSSVIKTVRMFRAEIRSMKAPTP